ncbi:hypothetical protein [Pyrococcus kukulkanii]|uniref:Uncharacterized protein n=1 Tax=Pyrococcus kukulkanii TaxID=1609559 RepID=A0ABV4T945_9EURY
MVFGKIKGFRKKIFMKAFLAGAKGFERHFEKLDKTLAEIEERAESEEQKKDIRELREIARELKEIMAKIRRGEKVDPDEVMKKIEVYNEKLRKFKEKYNVGDNPLLAKAKTGRLSEEDLERLLGG